jgi:hypothetical protein
MQIDIKTKTRQLHTNYDYSALDKPVTIAQLIAQAKIDLAIHSSYLFAGLAVLVFIVFFVFVIAMLYTFAFSSNLANSMPALLFWGFIFLFFAMLFVSYRKKLITTITLQQFAQDNNVTLIHDQFDPQYNGMIFNFGHSRVINHALVFNDIYNSQIGNYSFTTGSGKSSKQHSYHFAVFDLPRHTPHMLLDAKNNNFLGMFSNLPASFSGDQKLSLEGDFNDYFTLYAPKQYEKDALYIFTPDVMQAVTTYANNFDIEIIDNKLYLYTQTDLNLTSKTTLESLQSVIHVLAKQFYQQTDYYADSTIGNRTLDIIAPAGKRLAASCISKIISAFLLFIFLFIWAFYAENKWLVVVFVTFWLCYFLYKFYVKHK